MIKFIFLDLKLSRPSPWLWVTWGQLGFRHTCCGTHLTQVQVWNTSNKFKLQNQSFNHNFRKIFFSARIVNIWNSLPNYVVDVQSVDVFKVHIEALSACICSSALLIADCWHLLQYSPAISQNQNGWQNAIGLCLFYSVGIQTLSVLFSGHTASCPNIFALQSWTVIFCMLTFGHDGPWPWPRTLCPWPWQQTLNSPLSWYRMLMLKMALNPNKSTNQHRPWHNKLWTWIKVQSDRNSVIDTIRGIRTLQKQKKNNIQLNISCDVQICQMPKKNYLT